jgi:hypothetical protein
VATSSSPCLAFSRGDEDIATPFQFSNGRYVQTHPERVERYQKFALGSCTGGGMLKVDSVP